MHGITKWLCGAALLAGSLVAAAAPASAGVNVSIGIGAPGYHRSCAYYNYYGAPPPGYCGYDVYDGPIFWDGYWYRGPVYYRWYGGRRVFWLNGGWRDWDRARFSGWEGGRWHDFDRGYHGDRDWRGGGRDWRGGDRGWHGGGHDGGHGGGHGGHR